jgi:hypothetical protein
MLTPDLTALFISGDCTLPFTLVGAMFPFFGKTEKPSVSKKTVESITVAVHRFLENRGVINFKVYTLVYEDKPVILIQAEPQKKLRFSNILEIQIKKFIREKLDTDVPGVFWRFKTDYREEPGPEQADYEFDEQPAYPQDTTTTLNTVAQATETQLGAETTTQPKPVERHDNHEELYDIRNTKKDFEVEEITLGEFDEFLKGNSPALDKEAK